MSGFRVSGYGHSLAKGRLLEMGAGSTLNAATFKVGISSSSREWDPLLFPKIYMETINREVSLFNLNGEPSKITSCDIKVTSLNRKMHIRGRNFYCGIELPSTERSTHEELTLCRRK
jgi:hypothetical protein